MDTDHRGSILAKILRNCWLNSWMINVGWDVLLVFIVYHMTSLKNLIFDHRIFGLEVCARFELINLMKWWAFLKFEGTCFVKGLMEVLQLFDAMLKVFYDCVNVGFVELEIGSTGFLPFKLIWLRLFLSMLRDGFVEEGVFLLYHWEKLNSNNNVYILKT